MSSLIFKDSSLIVKDFSCPVLRKDLIPDCDKKIKSVPVAWIESLETQPTPTIVSTNKILGGSPAFWYITILCLQNITKNPLWLANPTISSLLPTTELMSNTPALPVVKLVGSNKSLKNKVCLLTETPAVHILP